jgi:hypothetical protein
MTEKDNEYTKHGVSNVLDIIGLTYHKKKSIW